MLLVFSDFGMKKAPRNNSCDTHPGEAAAVGGGIGWHNSGRPEQCTGHV